MQFNYNIRKGVAFNYIPGRNNITCNSGKKSSFAYSKQFTTRGLIRNEWKMVKRDETYKVYLDTLNECLKYFKDYSLYDLEMVLFSNPEKECIKAMNSVSNSEYNMN